MFLSTLLKLLVLHDLDQLFQQLEISSLFVSGRLFPDPALVIEHTDADVVDPPKIIWDLQKNGSSSRSTGMETKVLHCTAKTEPEVLGTLNARKLATEIFIQNRKTFISIYFHNNDDDKCVRVRPVEDVVARKVCSTGQWFLSCIREREIDCKTDEEYGSEEEVEDVPVASKKFAFSFPQKFIKKRRANPVITTTM